MVAKNKKNAVKRKVESNKNAIKIENPNSIFDKTPVWKFDLLDLDHDCWSLEKCDFKASQLIRKLKHFESMKWRDIFLANGGKSRGTNNHHIPINNMIKPAQQRAKEINIDVHQELFSLRFNGTERILGVLTNGEFHMVWYDKNHEICPSSKRNT